MGSITAATSRAIARLQELEGWRARLAAMLLGVVSLLAMPPYGLWPIWFITLPLLVILLDKAARRAAMADRVRSAAATGWWFGFGYFLFGLYWIGEAFLVEAETYAWLLPFAVSGMPAGLALFFAAACALAILIWPLGWSRVLALAVAFGLMEWLRGTILTGFPWHSLGYALTIWPPLMQSAAVIGVNGLNPLAVLIFASPVTLLDHSGPLTRRIGLPVAMLAVLAAMALFGSARLAERTQDAVTGVRLRLMQPNIPQHEKWAGENRLRIFQTYLDVSARNPTGAVDGLQGITHLIWPESSVPFLLLQSREALDAIAALLPPGALLVTGALRAEQPEAGALNPDLTVYNSLAVIDSEGLPLAVYDKRHLVPFGEYLPFQATLAAIGLEPLTRLRGSLAAGTNARLLAIPGTPVVVPLICYEAIFPRDVASPGDRAGWLLNVTNDAWFGASAGPYQHLHQARVRAVEQGLPMVRVANTGVSAVIDPWGRILASLPLGTRGSIDSTLPAAGPLTPYSTHGDLSLWLLLVSGLTVLAARALIRPAGSGD